MAKFKIAPTVNVDGYFSAKLKGAITDADVGKAVRLSNDTTDTYELCADGAGIDAFIVGIDPATADGLVFATLNKGGYVRVEAAEAMGIGNFVEAAAQAAPGTAEANGLAKVAVHTASAGDVIRWRIVSANTTDGVVAAGDTTVVIERV
jgi:hypothetical protein